MGDINLRSARVSLLFPDETGIGHRSQCAPTSTPADRPAQPG